MILDALIASLVLGALSLAAMVFGLRAGQLRRRASIRAQMWLVALLALAAVTPSFLLGSSLRPFATVTVTRSVAVTTPRAPYAPHTKTPPVASPDRLAFDWKWVWFAGVAFVLARTGLGLLRLALLMRSATPLAVRQTRRGRVRIVRADLFDSPVAVGYLRPAVIIPSTVHADASAEDLENMVLHEIQHLERYDDVASLVQVLCLAVLWFNPFAYMIAARLSAEREMAADEAVVACTGRRRNYATTLWSIATHTRRTPHYLPAFQASSNAVPRLENLLDCAPESSKRHAAVVLVAAMLLQASVVGAALAGPSMLFGANQIAAYTRVRLSGGETLVLGGRDAGGHASRVAQLYDRSGHRIALIPMNVARIGPSVTPLRDGTLLILGGLTDAGVTAASEIYQPRQRRFRETTPMPQPRIGQSATSLPDGRVVIASGERAPGRYVEATEIFDPRTQTYQRTNDGDDRINQTAVLVDRGSVLLYSSAFTNCVIIYDPSIGGYRSAGKLVSVSSTAIVTRHRNGPLVTHPILQI